MQQRNFYEYEFFKVVIKFVHSLGNPLAFAIELHIGCLIDKICSVSLQKFLLPVSCCKSLTKRMSSKILVEGIFLGKPAANPFWQGFAGLFLKAN